MEQYIKKSALVAEIEKLKGKVSGSSSYCNGWQHSLRMLELSLNTLEVKEISDEYDGFLGKELKMVDDEIERLEKLKVKEMDLDKEIDLIEDKYHGFESLSRADIIDIAKYFFKLGLRVHKDSNDAFIKKACEFIEQNITGYIDVTHKGGDENITLQEGFIDEFKKYTIESD